MTGAVIERSHYMPEEIERGLLELAITGGRPVLAIRRLEASGQLPDGLNEGTLRYWRDQSHSERYQELATQHARRVEDTITQQARETALLAAEVERQAIEATAVQIATGQIKDASTAARNLSTVKGINVDKLLTLTGRPTQITHTLSAEEVLRELAMDGTVEDAEVVPLSSPCHVSNAPASD